MTKKKSRRQTTACPQPRPSGSSVGRYYRHNRKQIQKSLLYAAAVIVGVLVIWGVYSLIVNRGITLTKEEYVELGRRQLMLGSYPDAVLNYHKALNADPNDKQIQREYFLARMRDNMSHGGTLDAVQSAANQLNSEFPSSLVGQVNLAQVFEMRGDIDGMSRLARSAHAQALVEDDSTAILAANLVLANYYRSKELQDSAFATGREALAAATAINDSFHVALARAGLAFAAVRVDSLDLAKSEFSQLLDYNGESSASFRNLALSGLADFYQRAKMIDSARATLAQLNHVIAGGGADGTTAFTLQTLGRVQRDTGVLDSARVNLEQSLQLWRNLQSGADVVDNLNDLAGVCRQQQDYFNARKYYMAAGTLADKFSFASKNLYTADLNLIFLKGLKPDEYLRAGDEGKAWAESYAGK